MRGPHVVQAATASSTQAPTRCTPGSSPPAWGANLVSAVGTSGLVLEGRLPGVHGGVLLKVLGQGTRLLVCFMVGDAYSQMPVVFR